MLAHGTPLIQQTHSSLADALQAGLILQRQMLARGTLLTGEDLAEDDEVEQEGVQGSGTRHEDVDDYDNGGAGEMVGGGVYRCQDFPDQVTNHQQPSKPRLWV
eukprot:scaffold25242_cov19-Tisochrysis_lutea.AAC.1